MATQTKTKTKTKNVSAAEAARREAQSKSDKGGPEPATVTAAGVTITINDPTELDDFDAMDAMDKGDFRPMLLLVANGSEEEETAIKDALREGGGKLHYSRVVEFVTGVFQELGQGN